MNVVAIIQARLGSTRLPGKVLETLGGQSLVARVVAAAGQIAGVNRVIVAWPGDAPHRAESDVLGRYADVARRENADVIVRLTGDCPLFDSQVGTLVVQRYLSGGHRDYVSNVYPRRTWPDGLDCEVFSYRLLKLADLGATDAADREHVTPWMQRRLGPDVVNLELPVDWSHVRLTCDTREDLEWLRVAIQAPRSP